MQWLVSARWWIVCVSGGFLVVWIWWCGFSITSRVAYPGFCVILYLYKGVLVEPHRLSTYLKGNTYYGFVLLDVRYRSLLVQ